MILYISLDSCDCFFTHNINSFVAVISRMRCLSVDNIKVVQCEDIGGLCSVLRPRCGLHSCNAAVEWQQSTGWCRCLCTCCHIFMQLHWRSLCQTRSVFQHVSVSEVYDKTSSVVVIIIMLSSSSSSLLYCIVLLAWPK